jgi:acetyl esterase/lipase
VPGGAVIRTVPLARAKVRALRRGAARAPEGTRTVTSAEPTCVPPLHAPDLSGLPGTLIVTAEHDPLRDESEAYARRLRDASVEVELRREPGLIHNFMLLEEISPACAAAADRVAADLRAHLNAP